MAGNQSDARRRAEWALSQAKKAGATPEVISDLQATYDKASYEEDHAMGKR